MKRDLKGHRVAVVDLLINPPEYIETMKVWDLLLATPKMGRVKVNKALNHVRISPRKQIGGISPRQRAELVQFLAPWKSRLAAGEFDWSDVGP